MLQHVPSSSGNPTATNPSLSAPRYLTHDHRRACRNLLLLFIAERNVVDTKLLLELRGYAVSAMLVAWLLGEPCSWVYMAKPAHLL